MAMIELTPDFKEFLRLLNSHRVEYLLVGGYAVGYHGYPRSTNDIDIWARVSNENAGRLCTVFREFGFSSQGISASTFLNPNKVLRIGVAPVCIDLLLQVSGLEFLESYPRRLVIDFDGIEISLLNLEDLKTNKQTGQRPVQGPRRFGASALIIDDQQQLDAVLHTDRTEAV